MRNNPEGSTQPPTTVTARSRRPPAWVNWVLALLTVPMAVLVVLFAFGAVMGTARCTDVPCAHLGPGEFWFGVLAYGPPVVAIVTIAVSFYTARRDRGIWVPLCGMALLVADLALLTFSFRP